MTCTGYYLLDHTSCDWSYHCYALCTCLLGIPPNSAALFNNFHGIYVRKEIELKHLASACIVKIISAFLIFYAKYILFKIKLKRPVECGTQK